jgi:hypothetical protein
MPDRNADPPQRLRFSSRAEMQEALQLLLGRTRRVLRCAAPDLSVFALDEVKPVAAMRELLLAHPENRILLLADDTTWLDTRAPRLRGLQRDFSHALLIRRADPQDPIEEDMVVVGDDLDALRLQPTIGIVGELWCRNNPFAQPLLSVFDRRWEHASHNLPSQPLGL